MAAHGRPIRGYRDLEVWQRAVDLVIEAYRVTKTFPAEERYGLTSQIRRSAVSIASNIAEGRGRQGLGGFLYHLSVANGSLMEVETQLLIAVKLGYVREATVEGVVRRCSEVGRMLAGLIRALKRRRATSGRSRYPIPGT
jgi:four helix bundle protein